MYDRIIADAIDRGQTDAALWHVDNTLCRYIIHAVFNCSEVGEDILDLLALIEINGTDDAVWNVIVDQLLLKYTGLCIGAV